MARFRGNRIAILAYAPRKFNLPRVRHGAGLPAARPGPCSPPRRAWRPTAAARTATSATTVAARPIWCDRQGSRRSSPLVLRIERACAPVLSVLVNLFSVPLAVGHPPPAGGTLERAAGSAGQPGSHRRHPDDAGG